MSNFEVKNVQNSTSAGAPHQTPFVMAVFKFKGPISNGREGERRVNEGERWVEKRSLPPNFHRRSTPLV